MPELPRAIGFRPDAGLSGFVRELGDRLAALAGWRRPLAAFVLGAVGAAALPPVDMAPALLIAFPGLLLLAEGRRGVGAAFLTGWCFGLGFFLASLYWIAAALFVDIDAFWWLVPFAALGLPAVFAIYTGLVLAAVTATGWRGIPRILVFAVAWSLAEFLRGTLFTGFPWNLVGYAWSGGFPGSTVMLQATALFGIHGLSFLTVLAAALPAALAEARRPSPLWAALAILAALALFGALRLADAETASVPGVRLRVVQPSVPQSLKWDPVVREANFRRHLALSAQPSAAPVTHVIWPEAAVTTVLNRDAVWRDAIARVAPPGGLVLAGALRAEPESGGIARLWNSLFAIAPDGRVPATYDKAHLVPFGEYVPFRDILPLPKVTAGSIDFSAGPGPQTLTLPGVPPVSPLICYEVIFPGRVAAAEARPGWLLNLTNDAWYGRTSGPFQHFAIARVRAVEEGLPLVRSANNGISGIVDPYGRVTARLALDIVGVLDGALPQALAPTVFARHGHLLYAGLLLACLLAAVLLARMTRGFRH